LAAPLALMAPEVSGGEPSAPVRGRAFDLASAERRAGVGVARIEDRATDARRYEPGLELRWTDELGWDSSAWAVRNGFGASLRLLHDGYALSLGQSTGLSGARLGPLQLVGGVGVSVLNASWDDGDLGFGMFWPRSSAGVCFDIGAARVDVIAHVEYLWNWFGADRFARGLGIMVSWPRAPVRPPFKSRGSPRDEVSEASTLPTRPPQAQTR
jgi:hypothetical protein